MERFVCIHGHFYQPPRENAWLEQVEIQDSAYPYHDWNERIDAECYRPNAEARILDIEGYITRIVNNYASISFDVGPTLLSWMERSAPRTYQAILAADGESRERFSGHGSAIAQPYNHMIMPLATRRDKSTQVRWGIADFRRRFNREPEGMWLPETAVDIDTLEVLAEHGLKFTILAPRQAARTRGAGSTFWTDATGEKVDPTTAYMQELPSGRSIVIFFYNGPIARAVAFERLLENGETFARRLVDGFSDARRRPQLVNVAVDGETFGHHHRFGEMALAYALHYIQQNDLARVTNYGEYLEKHPPVEEVQLLERSSWSCPHGVERWRSDCGCDTGQNPDWSQAWRAPLRESLDWLRDTVAPSFEERAGLLVNEPWLARDEYINVIFDRSPESLATFIARQARRELNADERVTLLKLMELQRHAMLMYTSCGWFFDEVSRIETVQVMQYAGRVVQLARELFGSDIEPRFLESLGQAVSNLAEHGTGRRIYERFVQPAMADLTTVAAHFAVSSLFEDYGKEAEVFCYNVAVEDLRRRQKGRARLAVGKIALRSTITAESGSFAFGALYFGEHTVNAGVASFQDDDAYGHAAADLTERFEAADFAGIIRSLDRSFGTSAYSLKSLFRDEQRRTMGHILEGTLADIEKVFRQLYEHHYPPMRFLTEMGNPLPKPFKDAAEFIINTDLRRVLTAREPNLARVEALVSSAATWGAELDTEGHGHLLRLLIGRMMESFASNPDEGEALARLTAAVAMSQRLSLPIDLGEVQYLYYRLIPTSREEHRARAQAGDASAAAWLTAFDALGDRLRVRTG
ncbi:MAG: DUF3536 domain-containing protein [Dehalococcoidia bacterium]|nr:DUF3536 domain-containing protein [Dehalococcoidia bacterium]